MTDHTSQIVPFQYEGAQVRTVVIDGEPWFVLADLCRVLDIANPSNVAARLDQTGINTLRLTEGNRGNPNVTIINEPNMYEVVIRSDKPEAITFRRWLTREVLPEIRKTGSYGAPALQGPQLVAAALLEANKMLTAKDEQIAQLTEKAAEDAPKVNYVELYVAASDLLKLRTVAANTNVGEEWLRDLLVEKGWIYVETDSRWSNSKGCKEVRRRYSAYAHKRPYFRPVENHEAPRFRGEVMHTLKVTPAGAEAIARLIAKEQAA
ncbi:BRO family protein [Hoyosella altamirensis]|uniref:Prophage antirepressor-like protein n=1 Tax=Hoyosella altamirensis TaxID=616997 RepID=A0A839RT71_9ACTN|nr:BRO family protein [Hoyosella altamirensis]MBB3039418.1 prophage antirepressor-like protein [Hoyosella altamirensis]